MALVGCMNFVVMLQKWSASAYILKSNIKEDPTRWLSNSALVTRLSCTSTLVEKVVIIKCEWAAFTYKWGREGRGKRGREDKVREPVRKRGRAEEGREGRPFERSWRLDKRVQLEWLEYDTLSIEDHRYGRVLTRQEGNSAAWQRRRETSWNLASVGKVMRAGHRQGGGVGGCSSGVVRENKIVVPELSKGKRTHTLFEIRWGSL